MLTALWDNPAASAFALLGTTCLIGWPLCSTRRGMLLVQIGIGIGFGLHYALWGSATAALVNGLGAVQTAAALLFGTNPRLRWLGYGLIPALAGACVLTWNGLPSILAAVGQILIALGRVQINPSAMRSLVLSGLLFWLAHDGIMGSPLLFADLLCLTIGVVALVSGRGTLVRAKLPHSVHPA
jgi:hypothetical protein